MSSLLLAFSSFAWFDRPWLCCHWAEPNICHLIAHNLTILLPLLPSYNHLIAQNCHLLAQNCHLTAHYYHLKDHYYRHIPHRHHLIAHHCCTFPDRCHCRCTLLQQRIIPWLVIDENDNSNQLRQTRPLPRRCKQLPYQLSFPMRDDGMPFLLLSRSFDCKCGGWTSFARLHWIENLP